MPLTVSTSAHRPGSGQPSTAPPVLAALICVAATMACMAAGSEQLPAPLRYLGQMPPGTTPVLFAPGIVSTDAVELNAVFAPDGREFFFSRLVPGADTLQYPETTRPVMHHMRIEGDTWSAPRPLLLFPDRSKAVAVDMSISPDGEWLYFMGQHPQGHAQETPNPDIWVSRRVNGAWAPAQVLPPPINTAASDVYSSVVADGSLYFTSNRGDGAAPRRSRLYRAQRRQDGRFADPVDVGPPINGEFGAGDTFVAPDESYLILTSGNRPGGFGQGDLWVSFRGSERGWTEPVNLGDRINTKDTEFCPMVTPDGKYLFFSRRIGPNWEQVKGGDVYWVDVKVLDALRR
jgi:hypothetical protein